MIQKIKYLLKDVSIINLINIAQKLILIEKELTYFLEKNICKYIKVGGIIGKSQEKELILIAQNSYIATKLKYKSTFIISNLHKKGFFFIKIKIKIIPKNIIYSLEKTENNKNKKLNYDNFIKIVNLKNKLPDTSPIKNVLKKIISRNIYYQDKKDFGILPNESNSTIS